MERANKHLPTWRVLGRRRSRASFVLVEVLLAMTILGISGTAFLKSFSYSLKAARQMEIMTQAGFLAQSLFEKLEANPPAEGDLRGDFGQEFKNFRYEAKVTYVNPNYDVEPPDDVEQLFVLREASFDVIYDDGVHDPTVVVTVDTAIEGIERFSSDTKKSYRIY